MKEVLDVTFLAVLQGVAEFLPISSSGHLVLGQHALGVNPPGMRLDVFLHLGTLVSVFVFYRAKIAQLIAGLCRRNRDDWLYAVRLGLSTVPAVVVYLFFKDNIEEMFENPVKVGGMLIFTGIVLTATRFLPRGEKGVGMWRALLMGCAQAVALLPGVSRSGMTLAAARAQGVSADASAEFSFLMCAPLILGGALLQVGKALTAGAESGEPSWGVVAWGAAVAAVIGYFSLALLLRTLRGKGFWLFGPYCFTAGLLVVCFCK